MAAVAVVAVAATVVRRVTSDDGVAWRTENPAGIGRLVASDDTVCGTDDDEDLFCLDAADGHELFRQRAGSSADALTFDEGVLLVGYGGSGGDRVTAYRRDGEEMEETWTTGVLSSAVAPPVAGGVVLTTPDAQGTLRALDLTTGDPSWERTLDTTGSDRGSRQVGLPTTDGVWFYVTLWTFGPNISDEVSTHLVALDPTSGEERWRTTVDTAPYDDVREVVAQDVAAVDDSTTAVVLGETNRNRRLLVVESDTGDTVWEERLTDEPAVVAGLDGIVVVLSGERLQGYTADGRSAWSTTVPVVDVTDDDENVLRSGDLLAAHGRLYVDTTGVWAVDRATGDTDTVVDDDVGPAALTREHLVAADGCCTEPAQIQAYEVAG